MRLGDSISPWNALGMDPVQFLPHDLLHIRPFRTYRIALIQHGGHVRQASVGPVSHISLLDTVRARRGSRLQDAKREAASGKCIRIRPHDVDILPLIHRRATPNK